MRLKKLLIVLAIVGLSASLGSAAAYMRGGSGVFKFEPVEGKWLDVMYKGKRIARYMCGHDTSDAAKTFETYKPFLHVYDPTNGRLLTNGPDGENPYVANKITYPHHRGIFIGWNKTKFNDKSYDLWHMPRAHQVHQEFSALQTKANSAQFTSVVKWNDDKGEPIIVENRTMTFHDPGTDTGMKGGDPAVVIDFDTELKAVRGDVYLDGDPEHAGMQYRPHNDVASGPAEGKAKYLFHADGIDPKKDKDLPWVVLKYELDGKSYVVQYMNHPSNPKSAIYSAYRDYGRFGSFFKTTIKKGETLKLHYRIWIGRGDMPTRADVAGNYASYLK